MLEAFYDTMRAIIFTELPKNSAGQPVIYDLIIKGWQFGDRTVEVGIPQLTFQAASSAPKKIAFGTWRVEHTMSIKLSVGLDATERSERGILELARLVREAILPHNRIWVMTPCPICLSHILSPAHFMIVHSSIFTPYFAAAIAAQNAIWAETHLDTDPVPTWENDRVNAVAFYNFYADVQNNVSVTNLTATELGYVQAALANKMRPISLFSQVEIADVKPSTGGEEKGYLHEAEFTMKCMEIYRQPAYGPSNVPTTAFTRDFTSS